MVAGGRAGFAAAERMLSHLEIGQALHVRWSQQHVDQHITCKGPPPGAKAKTKSTMTPQQLAAEPFEAMAGFGQPERKTDAAGRTRETAQGIAAVSRRAIYFLGIPKAEMIQRLRDLGDPKEAMETLRSIVDGCE